MYLAFDSSDDTLMVYCPLDHVSSPWLRRSIGKTFKVPKDIKWNEGENLLEEFPTATVYPLEFFKCSF